MKSVVILFLCATLSSCFLFSKYRRTDFTYNEGSQSYTIPVVVPKGFVKERTEVDSSGNTILSYVYKNNALFYIAHLEDTAAQVQPIAEDENQPRISLMTGALVYKGLDSFNLYWREVRRNDLRFGYRFVPKEWEIRFDSATNYGMVQRLK
ncbi:MAG: hypothetical protein ACTHMD_17045 [Flavisolibacter sp.]